MAGDELHFNFISGSAVASAILYLEQIDTDKSSKLALRLRTANKEDAQVTLQVRFVERCKNLYFIVGVRFLKNVLNLLQGYI